MDQQRALFDEPIDGPGLDVELVRGVLDPVGADAMFDRLRGELPWRQEHLLMFGRRIAVPRLEAWIADDGLDYTYSGIRHAAVPWTPSLVELRGLVSDRTNAVYNSVLCNLYRNGDDAVDWHADDEVEFGRLPTIASLSLGASRRFELRRFDDPSNRIGIELHHGDLLVMRGATQELWRHRIPRTRQDVGERINLTFRNVIRR